MLKKPKILVVGSLIMDLIAATHRMPRAGETVIGDGFHMAPGGKGANQAVQCARLGAQTAMVGCVGDDLFGAELLKATKDSGVDISRILVANGVPSGVGHIELDCSGENVQNRIIVCPGANHALDTAAVDWLKDEIGAYDVVMMQFELPMELIVAVAELAAEAGTMVMINPAPAAVIPDRLIECGCWFSPNEHEAAELTGKRIGIGADGDIDMNDAACAVEHLHKKGIENVIITCGENGSVYSDGAKLIRKHCVKANAVVDPTAAGDSFVAAFCTGIAAGLPAGYALDLAGHAAALTVSRMGAMPSLPDVYQVQSFMRDRKYQGFDISDLDLLK